MRRKFGSTKYARRERDYERMAWCKTLACAVAAGGISSPLWMGPAPDACQRGIEAHHAGERGIGQKAPDNTVIPLCDHHHDALTDRRGIFGGWPHHAVKLWELGQIDHYQRVYARLVAGSATEIY